MQIFLSVKAMLILRRIICLNDGLLFILYCNQFFILQSIFKNTIDKADNSACTCTYMTKLHIVRLIHECDFNDKKSAFNDPLGNPIISYL